MQQNENEYAVEPFSQVRVEMTTDIAVAVSKLCLSVPFLMELFKALFFLYA